MKVSQASDIAADVLLNQGFSNFFVLRPHLEKIISVRPHYYGYFYVNDIKA